MGKIKDLSKEKFGRLTPIKVIRKDNSNRAMWLCKCDCGKETVVSSSNLQSGNTQSCGCLMRHK